MLERLLKQETRQKRIGVVRMAVVIQTPPRFT
jgi:hypothetical protein